MGDITYEKINLGRVKGEDGKSAYQIWLEKGNTGTEEDFLANPLSNTNIKNAPNRSVNIIGNPDAPNTVTENSYDAAAFGSGNIANNREVFVHGFGNTVNGNFAHGEGFYNVAHADISHTEGQGNVVGDLAQVEIRDTGEGGHAEGYGNLVLGKYAHAGGKNNVAKGDYSNSDGVGGNDWANPDNSEIATTLTQFDEVQYIKSTQVGHGVSYTYSNNLTYLSGARFDSGTQVFSSFVNRLKNGDKVRVINSMGLEQILTVYSSGEDYIYVNGKVEWQPADSYIIVEALLTEERISSGTAGGVGSSVSGLHNYAMQDYQRVIGKYNKNKTNTLFEIGNGTSNEDRKNAFEVLEDGRAKIQSAPIDDDDIVRRDFVTRLPHHISLDSYEKEAWRSMIRGETRTLDIVQGSSVWGSTNGIFLGGIYVLRYKHNDVFFETVLWFPDEGRTQIRVQLSNELFLAVVFATASSGYVEFIDSNNAVVDTSGTLYFRAIG